MTKDGEAVDDGKFLDALGAEAESEMRRIEDRAGEEVGRILADAEEAAGRAREERLRLAAMEARSLRSRIVNAARLEGRKSVLQAVRHLAEEAVDLLREEVRSLPDREGYRQVLESLFDECTFPVGARVVCRPSDRPLLREIARERGCSPDFHDGEFPLGGFTVLSGDGRFAQRNSFEDRIDRARRRLLMVLGGRILPPGEEGGDGHV